MLVDAFSAVSNRVESYIRWDNSALCGSAQLLGREHMRPEINAPETSLGRAVLAIASGTIAGASLVTLFAVLSDIEYFRKYGHETDAAFLIFTYAIFIPNDWRRAAVVIGCMLAAGVGGYVFDAYRYRRIAELVAIDDPWSSMFLMLVIGFGTSVFGGSSG